MRFFYTLIICCGINFCVAQNYTQLAYSTPLFVKEVEVDTLKENQIYIAMPFAQKNVLNPLIKKQLLDRVIVQIDLVYTQYRAANSFNQQKLNTNRLKELNRLAPSVFRYPFWNFRLIAQTKANSSKTGKEMFHGFVVTFRPNASKKMLQEETNYLNNLVASMLKKDSVANKILPQTYHIKTHYNKNKGYVYDTIWYADTVVPPKPPDFFYNQSLYKDSTVLNAFKRNKSWSNFIVVTDVTGSMSPYSAQVFVWLKAQVESSSGKCFVFFNDGDEKPSRKKVPLKTKGIYISKTNDLESVIYAASTCMNNGGGGGENLENDIEAIIEGIKEYDQANEVILIADNMESMRDYKHLYRINKPVHIILCGAEHGVNIQYLDLARQTKGSVHTKKSDVYQLQDIKENTHFFMEEKEYLFKNGKFHYVYEMLN